MSSSTEKCANSEQYSFSSFQKLLKALAYGYGIEFAILNCKAAYSNCGFD